MTGVRLRCVTAAAFSILLATTAAEGAQDVEGEVPAELEGFAPDGFEILDHATGDLNGDAREDAVVVLRRPEEDDRTDEELPRPLLVLVRKEDGRLEQVARGDRVVSCATCGGMMGDPFEGVAIEGEAFTVSHYGGSAWRWGNGYTFAHDAARKGWFLESESSTSFHASDPDGTMEQYTIPREELGDVSLEGFDPMASGAAAQRKSWRVRAHRAHFYTEPVPGSPPRKAYLVKGDVVESLFELRTFVRVRFTNGAGKSTSGFVLRSDLEPLPPSSMP